MLQNAAHPRSYYKCTEEGCPAKKQIQGPPHGSPEEQTVTFKGEHNHPPPQAPRPKFALPEPTVTLSEAQARTVDNLSFFAPDGGTHAPDLEVHVVPVGQEDGHYWTLIAATQVAPTRTSTQFQYAIHTQKKREWVGFSGNVGCCLLSTVPWFTEPTTLSPPSPFATFDHVRCATAGCDAFKYAEWTEGAGTEAVVYRGVHNHAPHNLASVRHCELSRVAGVGYRHW